MISVAFDSQIFGFQRTGGVSRYIVELARHLGSLQDVQASILAPLHMNEHLATAVDVPQQGLHVPGLRHGLRTIADRAACDLMLSLTRPDVLHATYYMRRSRPRSCRRLVLTVHDMMHERFPDYFSPDDRTASFKRAALRCADHVVCISECTRRDLLQLTDFPVDQTSVVHHGALEPLAGELPVAAHGSPYLLFVGQRHGYKNFQNLMRAFAAIRVRHPDLRLIAFGGAPFFESERAELRQLSLDETAVVHLSGPDETLSALYRAAHAFVYPSLYEGFGMPLLEAMSHGCPVLCSDTSAMPEVAGDAAAYFAPSDVDSITAAISVVLEDGVLRRALIARGYTRAAGFTWDLTAERTRDVYAAVADR